MNLGMIVRYGEDGELLPVSDDNYGWDFWYALIVRAIAGMHEPQRIHRINENGVAWSSGDDGYPLYEPGDWGSWKYGEPFIVTVNGMDYIRIASQIFNTPDRSDFAEGLFYDPVWGWLLPAYVMARNAKYNNESFLDKYLALIVVSLVSMGIASIASAPLVAAELTAAAEIAATDLAVLTATESELALFAAADAADIAASYVADIAISDVAIDVALETIPEIIDPLSLDALIDEIPIDLFSDGIPEFTDALDYPVDSWEYDFTDALDHAVDVAETSGETAARDVITEALKKLSGNDLLKALGMINSAVSLGLKLSSASGTTSPRILAEQQARAQTFQASVQRNGVSTGTASAVTLGVIALIGIGILLLQGQRDEH